MILAKWMGWTMEEFYRTPDVLIEIVLELFREEQEALEALRNR